MHCTTHSTSYSVANSDTYFAAHHHHATYTSADYDATHGAYCAL